MFYSSCNTIVSYSKLFAGGNKCLFFKMKIKNFSFRKLTSNNFKHFKNCFN